MAAALLYLLAARPAYAVSCCGGASAGDALVLPKFLSYAAALRLGFAQDVDLRDSQGRRLYSSSWQSSEQKTTLSGAARLGHNWQAGLAMPLTLRHVSIAGQSAVGYGLGDANLALRYELLDEDTCYAHPATGWTRRDIRPTLHFFVRGKLPTGRAQSNANDPLGARITGAGDWQVLTGAELIKVWGKWGHSFDLAGGQSWPRADLSGRSAAWRLAAGGNLMWYPRYLAFVGTGFSQTAAFRQSQTRQTQTDVLVFGSWMSHDRPWWLRADLAATGVAGKSAALGWGGGVSLARFWY